MWRACSTGGYLELMGKAWDYELAHQPHQQCNARLQQLIHQMNGSATRSSSEVCTTGHCSLVFVCLGRGSKVARQRIRARPVAPRWSLSVSPPLGAMTKRRTTTHDHAWPHMTNKMGHMTNYGCHQRVLGISKGGNWCHCLLDLIFLMSQLL